MRLRSLLLLLGVLAWLAPALAASAADPLTVAVTIAPQEYFLKKVGGGRVQPLLLVPAGADPHVYEPRPGQMKSLARAAAWLTTGLEMEEAWSARFRAVNPGMKVAATDAGIAKLTMAGRGHEGDGHAGDGGRHELPDPHVWLSPSLAKVQAAAMRDALSALDPAGAAEYAANAEEFAAECDALAREVMTLLTDLPSRTFLVFHPSWGYFARDFGLAQLSIEAEGKEPSPRELARLVDQAREHGIRAIFVAPQFSRRTAGVVARELGAGLVEADPLAPDWADNLRRVARALAAAKTRN
ncbi:MAG: zinc ABC transporter substrate-binding protein [Thermodesulfobacteriota bacterium]